MLLTPSSCLTQARNRNFLLKLAVFCGDLLWSFLFEEEMGTSRATQGVLRNVPYKVTYKNIRLVARPR